jgi:hypothetical protein
LRATTLTHAFSTPPKVTRSGCKPSSCIHWNNSSALCPGPQFTCANNMAFQQTTFREDIVLNTLQASSTLPHLAYMSTKLLPTKVTNLQPLQSAHEQTCPLPVHLGWHTHSALPQKWKSRVIQQASRAASFSPTHEGFCGSPSQSAPGIFICVKSGYLTFTVSGLQSHHCEGSQKNSPHSFSRLSGLLLLLLSVHQPFHPKRKLLSLCGHHTKPLLIS